jgi:colanic acid/amylovoran biosynthesis glycosyltransferase
MRVLFLTDPFPVLSTTFILDQITGLIDFGVNVDVYSRKPEEQLKIHPDFYKYNIKNRLIYPNDSINSKFYRLIKLPDFFLSNYRSNPRTILQSLNFFKYGNHSLSLILFYEILPLLQRKPYDIIHAHFGPYGIKALAMKDIGALNGKLVTSFHGNDTSAYLQKHGNQIYSQLFSKGDMFLPISHYWGKKLVEIGCNNQKIRVHHMGIKCETFKFRLRKPDERKIRILSVARLVEKKGIKYGIKAVSILLKKNYNIKYQIIGDGPLKGELQTLIEKLDLRDRVELLGLKHRKEVINILEETDILLAPSITTSDGDMEGIPIVLMEAMAVGIPVISTIHSGIPELIQDGQTGFLVPEKNIKMLSEKIETLIRQPDIWLPLTSNARKYVETNFNVEKQNNKLLQYYTELL